MSSGSGSFYYKFFEKANPCKQWLHLFFNILFWSKGHLVAHNLISLSIYFDGSVGHKQRFSSRAPSVNNGAERETTRLCLVHWR